MMITEPGRVTQRITFLGRSESCIYLVDGGSESLWVEGGMAYVAPDILRQIDAFGIDERKIKRLVILHAHFDHCGLIPFFKRRWPWATVSASARAKELLSDPEITQRIADLNRAATARAGLEKKARQLGFEFTRIEVEETLGEADVISCGDFRAEVIEVPGHSSCSIAVYIPEERALFVSDAMGVRYKDFFLPAGNSNYDLYEASLKKMAQYEVDLVLTGHYGGAMGTEARTLLSSSIEDSKRARAVLEASYRRTRDVEKSTEDLVGTFMEKAPENFLSKDVFTIIMRQMMRHFAKTIPPHPNPLPRGERETEGEAE
jgi:glyoxylase-like metal-dependent hydrolase (beta-lactamase superfamily II)